MDEDNREAIRAALAGDLAELRRLVDDCDQPSISWYDAAVQSGRTEVLEWLRGRWPRYWSYCGIDGVAAGAAQRGNVQLLEWIEKMIKPQGEFTRTVAKFAASSGRTEVFEWLAERGKWSAQVVDVAFAAAAGVKQLKALDWMWAAGLYPQLGCAMDALTAAAARGNMKLLKWMGVREMVGEDGRLAALNVAQHVPVLKWLRKQGVPMKEIRKAILTRRHLHHIPKSMVKVFEYLLAHNTTLDDFRDSAVLKQVARAGDIEALDWLAHQGLTRHDAIKAGLANIPKAEEWMREKWRN